MKNPSMTPARTHWNSKHYLAFKAEKSAKPIDVGNCDGCGKCVGDGSSFCYKCRASEPGDVELVLALEDCYKRGHMIVKEIF